MIQYRKKVRMNTPQRLEYQFKDGDRAVINLANFTGVRLLAKLQGSLVISDTADFLDRVNGRVEKAAFTFPGPGVWDVQFFCLNAPHIARLYGEIIQVTVVRNVEDLELDTIANY